MYCHPKGLTFGYIMLPKGVNVLVWIITIIVPMAVLDHYGLHGGMHTLAFDVPNRMGNVLGRWLPWD